MAGGLSCLRLESGIADVQHDARISISPMSQSFYRDYCGLIKSIDLELAPLTPEGTYEALAVGR